MSLDGALEEVEGVLRRGQLLLQPGIVFAQPGDFFLQLRVAFHHSEKFFLQLGHALGQPLRFGINAWLSQLHGEERYHFVFRRAGEILGSLALECFATVRPRGPPRGSRARVLFWFFRRARLLTTKMR
jgi:hypothetical protein